MENTATPTALIFSRQNIANLPAGTDYTQTAKGAYIVAGADENQDVILVASGSEVSTLVAGAELLRKDGVKLRIVSVPSEGLFRSQSKEYQESIIPTGAKVFGLTAGLPVNLQGLVGHNGKVWGLESFGFSAPYKVLDEKLGFTAEKCIQPSKSNVIMKVIGLASDHAGFELKQYVKQWLEAKGWEYKDFGTYSTDSCDYPDFAHPLALAVEAGECYPGIAICGSGEGIGMTLNKHQGIRAALCWIPEIAHLARQHNDANVLVMPGRFINTEMADKIMSEFFTTDFEGGRHQARIDKIPVK